MTDTIHSCIFCDQQTKSFQKEFATGNITIMCKNCGQYLISSNAFDDLPAEFKRRRGKLPPRYQISGIIRDNYERGLETPLITNENAHNLVETGRIPHGVMDQLDRYMQYIYRHTEYFGITIVVGLEEYAIAFARNKVEMRSLTEGLVEMGWIKTQIVNGDNLELTATIQGLDHTSRLFAESIGSKQAFVAMWFEKEMDSVYELYISKAIEEAGYHPLVIRAKEHNNDVNAEIVAEIKKSRFIVADFTGQRGGVYFEAGYALGLYKPVIWTCSRDWFNTIIDVTKEVKIDDKKTNVILSEERRTHFDIEHFSFILWSDGKELKEKLYNRIRATISDADISK